MMKNILLVCFLLLAKTGWAQNKVDSHNYSFKFYNLSSYSNEERPQRFNEDSLVMMLIPSENFTILKPTIGLSWKTRNQNICEVELVQLGLNTSSKASDFILDTIGFLGLVPQLSNYLTVDFSFRYEYILKFNKGRDEKLNPSLGFGINPFYGLRKKTPTNTSDFEFQDQFFGADLNIVPRLTYNLSQNVYLDFSLLLSFANTYIQYSTLLSPLLSKSEQTIKEMLFTQFPKTISARMGVGIKL